MQRLQIGKQESSAAKASENEEDFTHPKKKFAIEDFEVIKLLGQGSFGKVKLVKHKATKQHFALKCLSKQGVLGRKQIQHIRNERDILQKFTSKDFCCSIYESL
jgi:serine/threonine protein kinase